jgi:proteic killer suppression protein
VIASFADDGTADVFHGVASRRAKGVCPTALWPVARRKLDQLNRVRALTELRIPPGNRLEHLRRDREGQHSVRINAQYRICFRWEVGHAYNVEIADYH